MIYGDYDRDVIGIGNPNHPANQRDEEPEMEECSQCETLFKAEELILDYYKGIPTGWKYCKYCMAEFAEEETKEKATASTVAIN